MDFQELGQTLKQERERQGLSIGGVMESTKISRTNIVAIENGDRSSLPHPVYAKGFVKSYARFLGLDAEELSMVVDQEYVDQADGPEEQIYEVSPAAEKAFQDSDSPEKTSRPIWPIVLVLLVLVLAGVLIFMNLNGDDTKQSEPEAQTEQMQQPAEMVPPASFEEKQVAMEEEKPVEEPATPPQEDVAVSDGAAEEVVPQEEAAPEETVPLAPVVPVPQPEKPVEQSAPAVETQPEKQKYAHMLVIRAVTEKGCWVGVWRGNDTNMSRDFVLQEGEPLRLMFNNPRRIRIGNVAGVTVTYNGKPYKLDASTSNIQTLRFGY